MIQRTRIREYEEAIYEAERFIKKARLAITALESDEFYWSGPHTAAAKRSSLDLTKILAKLRKPLR